MDLVVRVRASGDSSLTSVFRPLLAASAAAAKGVEVQLAGIGKAAARGAEVGAAAHRRAGKEGESAYRKLGTAAEEWAKRSEKAQDAAHKKALANLKELEREQKRAADAQAARSTAGARAERAATVASGALRTFGGLARTGVGAVGRAASEAFGVDVDVFAAAGRARETQDIAGRATRSAATAKGQIATAADVEATVKAIQDGGDRAKLGYGKMAEGLEDFVSKSSDLKTGTAVLARMGVIAQATGADVKDLLSAGGDVNRELDDSPDRAERLLSIMRLVAKQGAMGNVEVKDLARYMARVEATAFMYEGSKDRNIGILGALAQVSMKGGASSAAEATRSAAAFARDLTKSKSIEAFSKEGIDVFSDKTKTKIKSPEEIIAKVLEKTNGDLSKISNLFRNDASRKVMLGFASIYEQAGGGQKGIEATRGEFKRYSTTMSQEEMNAQARTALESDTAAAQTFKNELEKIGQQVGHEVAPSLKELGPVALGAAKGLSGLVSFGASHPETAITAAIVGSIGKAMGGTAGATFQIAAATLVLGKMAIDSLAEGANAGENKSLAGEAARSNALQSGKAALRGDKSAIEGYADVSAAVSNDMKRIIRTDKLNEAGIVDMALNTLMPTLGLNASILGLGKEAGAARDYATGAVRGMGASDIGEARADREKMPDIKADLARQSEVLSQLAPKLGDLSKAASDLAAAAKSFRGAAGAGPNPNEGARSGGVQ